MNSNGLKSKSFNVYEVLTAANRKRLAQLTKQLLDFQPNYLSFWHCESSGKRGMQVKCVPPGKEPQKSTPTWSFSFRLNSDGSRVEPALQNPEIDHPFNNEPILKANIQGLIDLEPKYNMMQLDDLFEKLGRMELELEAAQLSFIGEEKTCSAGMDAAASVKVSDHSTAAGDSAASE